MPDGNIEFIGRKDYQIKIRGFRIEIGEIEEAISKHPMVTNSVVTANKIQGGNEYLSAYVIKKNDELTKDEIISYLKRILPDYMIPQSISFLISVIIKRQNR